MFFQVKSWPLTEEQMLTYYTMVSRANQEREKNKIRKQVKNYFFPQNLSEEAPEDLEIAEDDEILDSAQD